MKKFCDTCQFGSNWQPIRPRYVKDRVSKCCNASVVETIGGWYKCNYCLKKCEIYKPTEPKQDKIEPIQKMAHYGIYLNNKKYVVIIQMIWDKLNEIIERLNKCE